ncbi:MAG: adenylosuccinate lyase [Verrucomicrobiaceae bacterium]|nr:adenylosuccinate lyase [Verrucomicrobiaceae bacterium]|tara:strand:- start:526 stop:1950 length:1425 start_codon:yes stop_codon:yes gene_type:complete
MSEIPNILADRYATNSMKSIWSQEGKVILERELWIAVMKAQSELGLDIPQQDISAYEKVKNNVDIDSIMSREKVTRHDVKARIEEFCDLAGVEHIHKGMTSRDLTENVEQIQIFKSLEEIQRKASAVLIAIGKRAEQWKDVYLTARTHNVAAQTTTMGKRIAMFGEEFHGAFKSLESVIQNYPARGIKGAVGTQLDQLALFKEDSIKVEELEGKISKHLGISKTAKNVGQVYPRSLDLRVVSILSEVCSAPSSFCKTLRLMAGHELAGEGFAKGQVGSSAMPHKMNARSCERVNGFHVLLRGYLTMASSISGDQWNEGDVSCSVVRRVMLPDSFFVADGLLETFITILNQMEIYPEVIEKENKRYLPFLTTTTFLMECVQSGTGREVAHEVIKEHAVAALNALRSGEAIENDLIERLANDQRLGIKRERLDELIEIAATRAGSASSQIINFLESLNDIKNNYPDSVNYSPGSIL